MSKIERVVKEVSDLRDFYLKIKKRKDSNYSQKPLNPDASKLVVQEEKPNQTDD